MSCWYCGSIFGLLHNRWQVRTIIMTNIFCHWIQQNQGKRLRKTQIVASYNLLFPIYYNSPGDARLVWKVLSDLSKISLIMISLLNFTYFCVLIGSIWFWIQWIVKKSKSDIVTRYIRNACLYIHCQTNLHPDQNYSFILHIYMPEHCRRSDCVNTVS